MNPKPKSRRTATLAALLVAHTALAVALGSAAHAAPFTERVSVNSAELQADGGSVTPAVSSDGSYIAFSSGATNFHGGTHNTSDVYVRDKIRGATELVSKASSGQFANGRSMAPAISGDGQIIAFQSTASNLATGDTNAADDIYVHDRRTAITTLVSVSSNGAVGNAASSDPAVSDDGRYVAYASEASNLVPGDTNNTTDVFVYDRVNRSTTRASVGTTGGQGTGPSRNPSISRNGQKVAFESAAANLIGRADTNGFVDVFVGTRTGVQVRVSQSSLGVEGNSTSRNPAISADWQRRRLRFPRQQPGQRRHQQPGGRLPPQPQHPADDPGQQRQQQLGDQRPGQRRERSAVDQLHRPGGRLPQHGDQPGQWRHQRQRPGRVRDEPGPPARRPEHPRQRGGRRRVRQRGQRAGVAE